MHYLMDQSVDDEQYERTYQTALERLDMLISRLEQKLEQQQERIEELSSLVQLRPTKEEILQMVRVSVKDEPIAVNSTFFGYMPLKVEKIKLLFNTTYPEYEIAKILSYYDKYCQITNLNPYIIVAQMIKETSWLTSWWSQVPRHNPANIGVTGNSTQNIPDDLNGWTIDNNIWREGISFNDWETAVKAHIGYILAYTLADEHLTPEQKEIIINNPRLAILNERKLRGKVATIQDLEQRWVSDGKYALTLVTLANKLREI